MLYTSINLADKSIAELDAILKALLIERYLFPDSLESVREMIYVLQDETNRERASANKYHGKELEITDKTLVFNEGVADDIQSLIRCHQNGNMFIGVQEAHNYIHVLQEGLVLKLKWHSNEEAYEGKGEDPKNYMLLTEAEIDDLLELGYGILKD